VKLLQQEKICTRTVQTPPGLLHCVTDRHCIAGEKRCPPPHTLAAVEAKYSEIQTININCKEIKQETIKNQVKPSAKLSTQTRKVLQDHKHVS